MSMMTHSALPTGNTVLPVGHDVMADFQGFLVKRKKEKNMPQRNTMESQINGLVTNLRTDIDKMMLSNERRKVLKQMSARSSYKH